MLSSTIDVHCRVCAQPAGDGDVVLDLGPQPITSSLPTLDAPGPDPVLDLFAWHCPSCALTQLGRDPDEPVREVVGVEPLALREQAAAAVERLERDGWLAPYVGGTVHEFGSPHGGRWSELFHRRGLHEHPGPADVVVDSFGIMHEEDQAAAVAARAAALNPNGLLVLQFHSLAAIVRDGQWNALRHGHTAYYSTAVMLGLLARAGLGAVAAHPVELYGGSVLLLARHGLRPWPEDVRALVEAERAAGVEDPERLRALGTAARRDAEALRTHLETAAAAGRRVYGFGAASRAVALLSTAGVDRSLLPGIADSSPEKAGHALPGTRIPVITPAELVAAEPEEILVFVDGLDAELAVQHPGLADRLVVWSPDRAPSTSSGGSGPSTSSGGSGAEESSGSSEEWRARLHHVVPGGAHTYARGDDQYPHDHAPVLTHGRGGEVWDVEGRRYVEYGSGLRSVTLGHAHPAVTEAVTRVLADGTNFSRPTRLEAETAERFLADVPGAEMVKFSKNGSDTTTAAVKLARAATGRPRIAVCRQPFFSVDDWFIGSTEMDRGVPAGTFDQTLRFDFDDLPGLTRLVEQHPGEIAAVVLSPAGPDQEPSPGYLAGVRALCDRHGIVLVFDEIVTGWRWAVGGVQALSGVVPDLACWAKGIGNGFPIAALTGRRELMELGGLRTDEPRVFLLSTTYGPESVGLAALSAVLDTYHRDDPLGAMAAAGSRLAAGVDQVVAGAGLGAHLGTRGHPACLLFWTHDALGQPSQAMRTVFLSSLLRHGVLGQSFVTGAAHHPDLVDRTIEAVARSLPDYRRALDSGAAPAHPGPPVAPALRRLAAPRRLP